MGTLQSSRTAMRQGTAMYMAVLSTALIVSLLGISGLIAVRLERNKLSVSDDRTAARLNANSAVELALKAIENDSSWRTTYTNGVETTPQSLGKDGRGTLSWILEDSDGSLTNGDTELRIRGVGRVNDIVQVSSVELQYSGAIDCLQTAVCSGGSINYSRNSITTADQVIAANSQMQSDTYSTINADVEAVGTISGTGYSGTITSPVSARTLPDSSVYDYYLANGTVIDFSSLPFSASYRVISDVVLSPTSNPFGATNAAGIYIIDCGGSRLRIEWSRINATLVILNPNVNTRIENSVNWEPATPNFPALLVRGNRIRIETSTSDLDESARGVNFNPPVSPYMGVSDADISDTYPSHFKGVVYSDSQLDVTGNVTVVGTVISSGDITVERNQSINVTYDANIYSSPPPGFGGESKIRVFPGSWLWDEAPR